MATGRKSQAQRLKEASEALRASRKVERRAADVVRLTKLQKDIGPPSKRRVKNMAGKAAPSWHLAAVQGVPGGNGKTAISRAKMIWAPYTGCRVASAPVEVRLTRSAQNSNTTTFRSGR